MNDKENVSMAFDLVKSAVLVKTSLNSATFKMDSNIHQVTRKMGAARMVFTDSG